jgi:hypothetical protein
MRTRRQTALIGVGIVAGALVILVGVAYIRTTPLSGASLCANEVVQEARSPDGTRRAVVFERDCGATTRKSTQLMILPADTVLPNEGGNVFVAYVDPALVQVSWASANSLILSRPQLPASSVFHEEPSADDVGITYLTRE